MDPDDDIDEAPEPRRAHRSRLPLTTSEDFDQLRPEWEALHAATPGASPFQHPAFVQSWLRTLGGERAPVFLAVRDNDTLAGVAALTIEYEGASLLGDPEVSDYGPILCAEGAAPAVARGIMEWLAEDLTLEATLWGMPEGSPLHGAFTDLAERFGWEVAVEPEANAPATALPADFDEFVAVLPKKDRHELRRKLRNLESAGVLTFEQATEPEAVTARFDRFLELMRLSNPDKATFLTAPNEAFFRDLATEASTTGFARLCTLTLNGEPLAITWSFETGGVTWLYNSGFDPGHPGLSLGIVSKALAIRAAIELGNHEFSFLRGDEDYKRRLGGQPRGIVRLNLRQLHTMPGPSLRQ